MHENIKDFCKTVRSRSLENQMAINLLYENKLYSNSIAVLRQELDLVVRALYIRGLKDESYRNKLIQNFIDGEKWRNPNSTKIVTDRQMVEYANRLLGYAGLVYKFGCSFIHLSNLQNWLNEDITHGLDCQARKDMVKYINQYHNADLQMNFTFDDIIPLVPAVFEKLHGNLECFVDDIENGNWCND